MEYKELIQRLQNHYQKEFNPNNTHTSFYTFFKGPYGNWVPVRLSDHCSEFERRQLPIYGVRGIDVPLQWGYEKIIAYIAERLAKTPEFERTSF